MYSARLNSESGEIRILTLLPGEQYSPIHCTLSTVSLSTLLWRPEYDALSYAWGDAYHRRNIILDGNEHAVTYNLEVALQHLRHRREKRLLWIDALCINQADVIERSEQVSMMGDIFSSARTVYLWIGEADQCSDGAFDAMSLLSSYRRPSDNCHVGMVFGLGNAGGSRVLGRILRRFVGPAMVQTHLDTSGDGPSEKAILLLCAATSQSRGPGSQARSSIAFLSFTTVRWKAGPGYPTRFVYGCANLSG